MADAPKDSDQSMEDILQSIKRIIADEGEATPPAASAGSDVLELTDLLAEDVAVPSVSAPAAEATAVESEPAPVVPSISLDEIMAASPEPTPSPVVPTPAPAVEPVMAAPAPSPVVPTPAPAVEPVMAAPVPATKPGHESVSAHAVVPEHGAVAPAHAAGAAGLMSDDALASSIAALNALSQASKPDYTTAQSPVFRSGATVEDLVIEALRPMVKDWLDSNLPSLVRQMVEKEIRRIRVEY